MNLFHVDLAHLGFDDIEKFCLQDSPEGVRLDYKREPSVNSPGAQVSKVVSALANTQGGVVVYGVGTRANSKHPEWPAVGMARDSDFEKRMTRWCIDLINPPVIPVIGYVENPNDPNQAKRLKKTHEGG
jgi:predicted HTH transcriptional regulator